MALNARYAANPSYYKAKAKAYRAANPEKVRAAVRKWHLRNPGRARAATSAWHARRDSITAEFLGWLKEVGCQNCGGKFPSECLDFDHRPERGPKLFNVATWRSRGKGRGGWDFSQLQAEIMKCDLVCANCHRTITRARRRAGSKES